MRHYWRLGLEGFRGVLTTTAIHWFNLSLPEEEVSRDMLGSGVRRDLGDGFELELLREEFRAVPSRGDALLLGLKPGGGARPGGPAGARRDSLLQGLKPGGGARPGGPAGARPGALLLGLKPGGREAGCRLFCRQYSNKKSFVRIVLWTRGCVVCTIGFFRRAIDESRVLSRARVANDSGRLAVLRTPPTQSTVLYTKTSSHVNRGYTERLENVV
eukprot:600363-Prorocentrum_minimum.AAC.2